MEAASREEGEGCSEQGAGSREKKKGAARRRREKEKCKNV